MEAPIAADVPLYSRKALYENFGSLFVLQAANYLLPFITLPYLVRVIGSEGYGLLSFAFAFVGYFTVLTDYGFNLTATREIAIAREDPEAVGEVFSAVMLIKGALLVLSTAIFAVVLLLVPQFHRQWPVHAAAFLMVLGLTMYPTWLYQGLEKMKFITFANITAKAAAAVAIFTFVRSPDDYVLATFLQASGFVIAGLIGLLAVPMVVRFRPRIPHRSTLRRSFVEGRHVFLSQASASLFSNTNVFILGLFASSVVVGHFAIAEKIVRAVIALSIPLCNSIFPVVSSLFLRSQSAAVQFLRRVMLWGGAAFLLVSAALLLGADIAVRIIAGEWNPTIAALIRIMSLLPFTVFADNLYGTQVLLNVGRQRQFARAVLTSGGVSLLMSLLLVPSLEATGSALALAATGLLVLVLMMRSAHAAGIRLHPRAR